MRDSLLQGDYYSAILPLSVVPSPDATLSALQARVASLEVTRGVGTVSQVGVGVGGDGARIAEFLSALGAAPLLLVGSPLRLSAVLPDAALAAAEQALHARL